MDTTEFEVKKVRDWVQLRLKEKDAVSAREVEGYMIGELVEKSGLAEHDKSKAKNDFIRFRYAERFLISLTSKRAGFWGRFYSLVPKRLKGAKFERRPDGKKVIYYPKRASKR